MNEIMEVAKNGLQKAEGVIVAVCIAVLWFLFLINGFTIDVNYFNPFLYLLILVQTHLFTGLFITAHDAMHGALMPTNRKLNHLIGRVSTFLYVYSSYKKLRKKHYEHHRFPGTSKDPDYHRGNGQFFAWYFTFLRHYFSLPQVIAGAVTYHFLNIFLPAENIILFWILPSLLSTFQLFYFGTFLPHRGEHGEHNHHRSTSLSKNHIWAFITCYFFGYHYEHHDSPHTPWYRLWKVKENNSLAVQTT